MTKPAERLEGLTLDDGWVVKKKLPKTQTSTGGTFSVGYVVENNKRQAFLKALDFSSALREKDASRALERLTTIFNFERDLLNRCKAGGLSRVVHPIADGQIKVDGSEVGTVQYLLFELADGDARSYIKTFKEMDTAWVLRTLHQIVVGIKQLHTVQIAHQDIKPSNILVYGKNSSKLADLGRASTNEGRPSPFDNMNIAGDWAYAPPELLYNHTDPDWLRRRLGCDLYLFGSMIVFFFAGTSMTAMWESRLHPDHRKKAWGGTYPEVLPFIRQAFGESIDELSDQIPSKIRTEIVQAIKELCDPDPAQRGHPNNFIGHQNRFSVEQYISLFDRLAMGMERRLFG